ncbi:FecR family protein [Brevundimonas aveniformis]|uniref:FecR family protein n=1 Tax=Brevundimonas aveniformis TaxID=370977 RepID=UPI000A02B1B0|nr:FecR family protein [Brevundimonas aveniformis]
MRQPMFRFLLGLLLVGAAAPVAAQTVGANAVVVNDVQMTTQANPQLHRAAVRERVSLSNQIQTGTGSRLQILLLDGTSFQVGANARLTVDRFVYDPNRSASEVGVNVAQGSFRFVSGAPTRQRPGQSGIRTPVASIGVRGTIVEGAVGPEAIRIFNAESGLPAVPNADPETATLVLLRGPGPNVPGEPAGAIDVSAGGRTLPIETVGYAAYIPGPGQPPIGPFLLSNIGQSDLAVLLGDPRTTVDVEIDDPLVGDPLIGGVLDHYYDGSGYCNDPAFC